MPCSGNCNQGRNCNCNDSLLDKSINNVAPVLIIIILISCIGMGVFMMHELFTTLTKSQDCAVEVQFSNGVKATYFGISV